jgi:histidinol-phosphate phosphatase family protein
MPPPPHSRRPALLFDRDGTLNVDHGYTFRPEDLRWTDGAREAVKAVNDAGWLAIVVTNQSGVARGLYTEADVDAFHARMQADLAAVGARIDAFYACPFHSEGANAAYIFADHPDRKPRPGMIRRAVLEHRLDRARSVVIGDHERDVQAAEAAGLRGVLVTEGELLGAVQAALSAPAAPAPALDVAAELAARARAARRWLFDHALPLWSTHGFDAASGCFHERLGPTGRPIAGDARRVRVQARQTYVFATAGRLGWSGPWRELTEAGVDALLYRGLRSDGGVRHKLGADGAPLDDRRDLYDLAFVVFALAHAARVLPQRAGACLAAARTLLCWIDVHWALPPGGYAQGDIDPSPRRQNPHMHLLEALLALHAATGDSAILARADALATLFAEKLYQPRRGVLPEYFDDHWRPMPGEEGRIVEPGHHFEWRWLLDQLRRAGGADHVALGERLRVHGEVYGVSAAGITMDELFAEGVVRTGTARLWPQTERLKANLVQWETAGDEDAGLAAAAAFDALMRYCGTSVPGLWRDRMDANGVLREEAAPASSFYHITLALDELIRVAG